MTFARPEVLILAAFLILASAALLHIEGRRRRRILDDFVDPATRSAILPPQNGRRRTAKGVLFVAAVGATAFALAGPRWGVEERESRRVGIDLMLLLDCSKSMLAQDVQPDRFTQGKREIADLLARLGGDRVGLVVFAGSAFLQCPLTLDAGALPIFLDATSPNRMPLGGTNVEAAVEAALAALKNEDRTEKALLLVTDGGGTTGDAAAAAERARSRGIHIFVLGIGSETGAPIPDGNGGFRRDAAGMTIITRLEEKTLADLAEKTGGRYVRSTPGDEDIDALLAAIRYSMELREIEEGKTRVAEDRFRWPVIVALVLLVTEALFAPFAPRGKGSLRILLIALLCAGKAASATPPSPEIEELLARQIVSPDDPALSFNIGNAYYRAGRYDEALRNYEAAADRGSKDVAGRALYNAGNALYRLGDLPRAAAAYEAAIAIESRDEDARKNLDFVRKKLDEKERERKSPDSKKETASEDKRPGVTPTPVPASGDASPSHAPSGTPAPSPSTEKATPSPAAGEGAPSPTPHPQSADVPESATITAMPSPSSQDALPRSVIDAMLGSLQDQPGGAPPPAYGPKKIEEDW